MPTGIYTRSQEHRAKIGKSLVGNQFRKGISHSVETRRLLSKLYKKRTDTERFWSKVEKSPDPDGCWLWIGTCYPNGYGQLRMGSTIDGTRRMVQTHRLSYEWATGFDIIGWYVCHSCDVNYPPGDFTYRRCIRPDHLFLGTQKGNIQDMLQKNRGRWRH